MINIEENKVAFKNIISANVNREGIDALMQWLDTTDFYTAPSSSRYHGAEPGGLCEHSLSVYRRLKFKQEDESNETIALVALFHDLCKANFYKQSYRNVKNDETGNWERVPSYDYSDQLPLGHGEKSALLLSRYIKLSDEELLAIRWHMSGFYSSNTGEQSAISSALSISRLVLKLIEADMESAFWDSK
jgi:hypothetical protein